MTEAGSVTEQQPSRLLGCPYVSWPFSSTTISATFTLALRVSTRDAEDRQARRSQDPHRRPQV